MPGKKNDPKVGVTDENDYDKKTTRALVNFRSRVKIKGGTLIKLIVKNGDRVYASSPIPPSGGTVVGVLTILAIVAIVAIFKLATS